MEQFQSFNNTSVEEEQQKIKLYPERASDSIGSDIAEIAEYLKGERQPLVLSEQERIDLLQFEYELGQELEGTYDIAVRSTRFYISYFKTEPGQHDLKELLQTEIIPDTNEGLKKLLLDHNQLFCELDGKVLQGLAAKSLKYEDQRLQQTLSESIQGGELSIEGVEVPEIVNIILNPEDLEKKLKALKQFKSIIKVKKNDSETSSISNLDEAKAEILSIYTSKVNQMLTESYFEAAVLIQKQELSGSEALSTSEQEIIENLPFHTDIAKHMSRFDKLIHGCSVTYNEEGWREHVSVGLLNYANNIELQRTEVEEFQDKLIREKGLDPKKLAEKNITPQQRQLWGEEVLAGYGIKSEYPSSTYDPKRSGPAPDNKWQYIIDPNRSSLAVNGQKKVILDHPKNSSIPPAITVALSHEIEGHVVQAENKGQLPLRLFQRMGGDRTSVLAEGGAMYNQNEVNVAAFGYESLPHPHYIRAMVKKLEGGNYLDCVKVFYDSAIASKKEQFEAGRIDQAQFQQETENVLEQSISRSKRLFRPGVPFKNRSHFLTKSKDTAYLEQKIVLDALEEAGLVKLAFIGGVNLKNALRLIKLGLLDLSKIMEPKDLSLEIWEREKEKYTLE